MTDQETIAALRAEIARLTESAANFEMGWFAEKQRAEKAEAEVARLTALLAAKNEALKIISDAHYECLCGNEDPICVQCITRMALAAEGPAHGKNLSAEGCSRCLDSKPCSLHPGNI